MLVLISLPSPFVFLNLICPTLCSCSDAPVRCTVRSLAVGRGCRFLLQTTTFGSGSSSGSDSGSGRCELLVMVMIVLVVFMKEMVMAMTVVAVEWY